MRVLAFQRADFPTAGEGEGVGLDAWGRPESGAYGPGGSQGTFPGSAAAPSGTLSVPAQIAPSASVAAAAPASTDLAALRQAVRAAMSLYMSAPTAENRSALIAAKAAYMQARRAQRDKWRAAHPGWGHHQRGWGWGRGRRQGWGVKTAGGSGLGPVLPGPMAPMNLSPNLVATGAVAPASSPGTAPVTPLPAPSKLSGLGRGGRGGGHHGGHRGGGFRAGWGGIVGPGWGYPIVIEQGDDEEDFNDVSPAFAGLYGPRPGNRPSGQRSTFGGRSHAAQQLRTIYAAPSAESLQPERGILGLSGPLDELLNAFGLRDPIAASYPNMPLSSVWQAVWSDIELSKEKLPGLRSDRKREELAGRIDQLYRMAADVEPAFRKPDSQIGKKERDKLADIVLKLDKYTKDWRDAKKQYGYADPDVEAPPPVPQAPPPPVQVAASSGLPMWVYLAGGALALLALAAGRR